MDITRQPKIDDKSTEKPDAAAMNALRQRIDALDDEIIVLLAQRQREIEKAALIKREIGMPARTPLRVAEVIERVQRTALQHNLAPDLAATLWAVMIEWSIAHEQRLMR